MTVKNDRTRWNKAIGRSVKLMRVELGLSQEQLAEKTSLHRTYIGMVERGERAISASVLFSFVSACHVGLSDFVANAEKHYERLKSE